MKKKPNTREELLDIIASYKGMIIRDNYEYPTAVLSDIKSSIDYVLERNGYNGKYAKDNK